MLFNGFLLLVQNQQDISLAAQTSISQKQVSSKKLLDLSLKYANNEPEKAKKYVSQAITVAREEGDKETETKSLYQLGAIYIRQGNYDKAMVFFEKGIEKSKEIINQFLTAQGFYNLSRFYESKNDFAKALTYLEQAREIYEKLGKKKNIAYCHISFGRIRQEQGNYEAALSSFFISLRINEELDNQSGISVIKSNIGHTYMLISKFDDAIRYFKEALIIDYANNDQEGILINMINLGATYQKIDSYKEALNNYKEALIIARQLNYKEDEGILLGNIGSTLKSLGHFEESLTSLFSALKLEEENNYNKAHTLNDIAETYLAFKKPKEASKYAQLAIDTSLKINDPSQLRYAYHNLAKSFKEQGNYKKAYPLLVKSYAIKDSLFSLSKEKQMGQLQLAYETEKKEQEIAALQQQKQTADFRRNTYLVSGLLITAILFLLYNQQRQKSKKNRLLFEKEHQLAKMKTNFFSNISHEFRTPLTLILGPIKILKSGVKNAKMSYHLDAMERNASRLLSLINQLLDLSKIESGSSILELTESDIVSVIKGVSMSFQSKVEAKKIELMVTSDVEHLQVYFDREKVETILINLITNSFNFTPNKGKISVSLEVIEDTQHKQHCKIAVKDNGKGIPNEDIDTIFNRFYQSSNQQDSQYDGSGIGLALTKELVELHKGSISAYSKEGEGTEINVMLPLGKAHFSEQEFTQVLKKETPKTSNVLIKSIEQPDFASTNRSEASSPILLLIEDNADVMQYIKEILGDTYQILEAKNGEAGIEIAKEHIPDLIISDVMMPKKNGYEVCKTLKQDEKTSHIPIILLTAKASLDDKMQGLLSKADTYLTKPFVPKELLVRIQNLIESREKLRIKYKKEGVLKPKDITVNSIDEKFLNRLIELVEFNMSNENFGVTQLSIEIGMSRSQLHRKLIGLLDQGPSKFMQSFRLQRAHDLLKQKAATTSEIAYQVGFGSPSYFTKCFRKHFGYTPTEIQNQTSKS
ncbi:tetratricopeptide repeat protein [Tamlana sp. 2201CG12-4]|uniref:tetratricopeptide repeat protein n=1 Tax=Tamlana sp. 2201CG12-4 TaxID=3112582 RepID=UPI002DBFBD69|nr:tetratricopeptide repeat protein [Tamlana sp. 2201CG12-4]